MSRDALQAYAKNLYANKFGIMNIKTVVTPLLLSCHRFVGAFIYEKQDKTSSLMLDWFVAPIN